MFKVAARERDPVDTDPVNVSVELPSEVLPVPILNPADVVPVTLFGKLIEAGSVTVASAGAPLRFNDRLTGNPATVEPETSATVTS